MTVTHRSECDKKTKGNEIICLLVQTYWCRIKYPHQWQCDVTVDEEDSHSTLYSNIHSRYDKFAIQEWLVYMNMHISPAQQF